MSMIYGSVKISCRYMYSYTHIYICVYILSLKYLYNYIIYYILKQSSKWKCKLWTGNMWRWLWKGMRNCWFQHNYCIIWIHKAGKEIMIKIKNKMVALLCPCLYPFSQRKLLFVTFWICITEAVSPPAELQLSPSVTAVVQSTSPRCYVLFNYVLSFHSKTCFLPWLHKFKENFWIKKNG